MNYCKSGDDFGPIKHSTTNSGTLFCIILHLMTIFFNHIWIISIITKEIYLEQCKLAKGCNLQTTQVHNKLRHTFLKLLNSHFKKAGSTVS